MPVQTVIPEKIAASARTRPGDSPLYWLCSASARACGSEASAPSTRRMSQHSRIATVAVGYADGWFRSSKNRAMASIAGRQVHVVGRISMDLMTLDVTGLDPGLVQAGGFADLIDAKNPVDIVGERAGTIGYEVLTSLGRRYHRVYLGG